MNFYASESDFIVGKVGKLKRYLICSMEGYFPVIAKTGPDSLAAIFRTGGPHIGISATVAVSLSSDGGMSWSDPKEITPRWSDARNPALGTNDKGQLIAAYWKAKDTYDAQRLKSGHAAFLSSGSQKNTNCFYKISRDGGQTWDETEHPLVLNVEYMHMFCPYGRIISDENKTLYMSVYGAKKSEGADDCAFILRSYDGGETWGDESAFTEGFNETAYVFTKSGAMVAAARGGRDGAVHIAHSHDKGKTWSAPKRTTRPGEHPGDLCELAGGQLLLTYGRRIRPMGCGGLLSHDSGETWDYEGELLLAGDGVQNGDLGYPSTVQLDDGTINTALYYASGSEPSHSNWGDVSCQLIKYTESDILK